MPPRPDHTDPSVTGCRLFSAFSNCVPKTPIRDTRMGGGYTMDKPDFIQLIQMARENAATETNILQAWQKSTLYPIQLQNVVDKLGLKKHRKYSPQL